jgi:hypothetical protein
MEVLNNIELEGRRINVEISKNDGGGRRDHNGRSSGVVVVLICGSSPRNLHQEERRFRRW